MATGMTASLSGPEWPKGALILLRFRGQFHEVAEGGTYPDGYCPAHGARYALYFPDRGWLGNTIEFMGEGGDEAERFFSRQHAEQWLVRGNDPPPCNHSLGLTRTVE